jgi:hypothetical protein
MIITPSLLFLFFLIFLNIDKSLQQTVELSSFQIKNIDSNQDFSYAASAPSIETISSVKLSKSKISLQAVPSPSPSQFPTPTPTRSLTYFPTSKPSLLPSSQPSQQPVSLPSAQPTGQPVFRPTSQPTAQPNVRPSSRPSVQPTSQPSIPTSQPTSHPSRQPTRQPSSRPSGQPTFAPTSPTSRPSCQPSSLPSSLPSRQPSSFPTANPTNPSSLPTTTPSSQPNAVPSAYPTAPSSRPSSQPSVVPSRQPISFPTGVPSHLPSSQPSTQPASYPTGQPSCQPTSKPSVQPVLYPTGRPSCQPTSQPSAQPVLFPTSKPTEQPTSQPTKQPFGIPTGQPSAQPVFCPTGQPSSQPSSRPTAQPVLNPTSRPSGQPTAQPSRQPVGIPTGQPSAQPVSHPTSAPSAQPTSQPSAQPFLQPTSQPTTQPTAQPSRQPFAFPTSQPSAQPNSRPTALPSAQPSSKPSLQPFSKPSSRPSSQPSSKPSGQPSLKPSNRPTVQPSSQPSSQPSCVPSSAPSSQPFSIPSGLPTRIPSGAPSSFPSSLPSTQPFSFPTAVPTTSCPTSVPTTSRPTTSPSGFPSSVPSVVPVSLPSSLPSSFPSSKPSTEPSVHPTSFPSSSPSSLPSSFPSAAPSTAPSGVPASCPSSFPSSLPSSQPSRHPTLQPASFPSSRPSTIPSVLPTCVPTSPPSGDPSSLPSSSPSSRPSVVPSSLPSGQPTSTPSSTPSATPTCCPTSSPSSSPSGKPTEVPSFQPLSSPSSAPTSQPTSRPSSLPTGQPTSAPSSTPSATPTCCPTSSPSSSPSGKPTEVPSFQPLSSPSSAPTSQPTSRPSSLPTGQPTSAPSSTPSATPTCCPTSSPSSSPSGKPTEVPSFQPLSSPSSSPTKSTKSPSAAPTLPSIPAAPGVKNIFIRSSSVTATVSLLLSEEATVYGKLYVLNSLSIPSSVSDIIAENTFAFTVNNRANLTFNDLLPSSHYVLYLLTKSKVGVTMNYQQVLATKTFFDTKCCRSVDISFTGSNLLAGQSYLNLINIGLSSLPSSKLSLSLQLSSLSSSSSSTSASSFTSSLLPNELHFPRLNSSSSSGQNYAVSLTSLSEGNYLFTAELTGDDTSSYSLHISNPSTFLSNNASSVVIDNSNRFKKSTILNILNPLVTLPAPTLSSAFFSNDGSSLDIVFSSSSNQGGFSSSSLFPCSSLFSFPCSTVSKCQWMDSKTVIAYVKTSDECAKPGDELRLSQEAKIKALCVIAGSNKCLNYDGWPITHTTASTVKATIREPTNPILPTVLISMPSKLSWNCSALSLDITGSYGNGGRSWRNLSIIVSSSKHDLDLSSLQHFLNTEYSINPPTAIPSFYFALPDVSYSFYVTLCNFLGKCNQAISSVTMKSESIPIIRIAGSTIIKMTRSQSLLLVSSATVSSGCQNGGPGGNLGHVLAYNWSVSLSSTSFSTSASSNLLLSSASKDPSRFLLSPYSLSSNSIYEMVLTVSSPLHYFQSTSTSVQVVVNSGILISKIKGGNNERNVRVGEILSVDASNSYDEDKGDTIKGIDAGLLFEWSCMQLEPVLNISCIGVFEGSSLTTMALSSPILTVKVLTVATNARAQWTLKLSDSTGSRSMVTSVVVSILPLLSPTISLQSNALLGEGGGVMNAGQSLQIIGTINIPIGIKSNATWIVLDSSLSSSLSSLALTPIAQQFPLSSSISQSFSLYLALPANSLSIGSSYTFGLKCQLSFPGKSALSTITVNVNSPPTPGSFTISPISGREILDSFTFLCNQWIDTNLPLSYQFSYLSLSGTKIVIRSSSIISYTSTILPGGSKTNNGSLIALADIYDSLSANTTSSVIVRVVSSADFFSGKSASSSSSTSTISQFASNFILKNLSSVSSVDDLIKGTAIASYLLNSANCSAAPNCSALHRLPCYSTSHTCGPCLSTSLIGQKGDSNDLCYDPTTTLSSTPPVSSILKRCTGDCSGHGTCKFLSLLSSSSSAANTAAATSSAFLSSCYQGDYTCVTQCFCDSGFALSPSCEKSDAEIKEKQQLREQVVSKIIDFIDLQDANEQTVSSWMNSLNEASQVSSELSQKSISSILSVANIAMSIVSNNGFNGLSTLTNLLETVDSMTSALISQNGIVTSIGSGRRQLSSSDNLVILDTLQNYSLIVASGMVPGQTPNQNIQSNFRLHIESYSPSLASDGGRRLLLSKEEGNKNRVEGMLEASVLVQSATCNQRISITLPATSLETKLGYHATSLSLPYCPSSTWSESSQQNTSTASSALTISLISIASSLYHNSNDFTSDPTSLYLSSLPCADPMDENCHVEIILKSDNSQIGVILEEKNITTQCLPGEIRNHTVSCHAGTGSLSFASGWKNHTVQCLGNAETFISTCPAISAIPTCNGLFGEMTSDIGCKVISYTERNLTCCCPLLATNEQGNRRSLLSILSSSNSSSSASSSSSSSVSINYVGMLRTIEGKFEKTILSASTLNNNTAEKSWQVLVIIGSLVLGFMIAMIGSVIADNKIKKKIQTEDTMLTIAKSITDAKYLGNDNGTMLSRNSLRKSRKTDLDNRQLGGETTATLSSSEIKLLDIEFLANSSLPSILSSSQTWKHRLWNELKRHHRWIGIIYYFSDKFPRILRVISLATNIIVMLFIQSLTYDLTQGDDGSCEKLHSEETCLQPKSSYGTSGSKCSWTPAGSFLS